MTKKIDDQPICRCWWAEEGNDLYKAYHDKEWGVPVHNDQIHFEFLILEGAQAGLSWITILKRRQGYKKAFANFNPAVVATYDERKMAELLNNEDIIRNKLKIAAAVKNAKLFLEIQQEFGSFDAYIWQFVGGTAIQNQWKSKSEIPPETIESQKLSKDLKKRGFKFVGSTIMYAHMQATGLVNDHTTDCFRHAECKGK